MNSSRKLQEMTPREKQAKKPWIGHHQRRQFWAGVQTIRKVPIRSKWWTVWQTSTSRKRGNGTRSFMSLFVSFFAYFTEDYFSPRIDWFRCAFITGNLGPVDPFRDDHDCLKQSFLGTRREADCLYTTRATRLAGTNLQPRLCEMPCRTYSWQVSSLLS